MRLYNLTYEDEYLVSCVKPVSLPEENYTLVEVIYSEDVIHKIKGTYKWDVEKECILTNLNISKYLEKLKEIENNDKIFINLRETDLSESERIKQTFIILLSSYLVYFNFLEFPYNIDLHLLTNEKLKYFTSFSPMNNLEYSFMQQVCIFHRFFSQIFKEDVEKDVKNGIQKINNEVDKLVEEVKEYKRKFLKDINIKEIKKEIHNIKKQLL